MFIRSERLMLRPIFAEDWRGIFAGISDEGVARMLARVPWPYAAEDARAFCRKQRGPEEMAFAITVPGRDGAPLIGAIELSRDSPENSHELGYWIAPSRQGHGYGSEAVGAVLGTARALGLPEVCASHFDDNIPSSKILQKWGFLPEGGLEPTVCEARGGLEVPSLRYRLVFDKSF